MSPGPVLSLSGRRRQRAAGERLSELFEVHGRMVYGICRLILRDPVEAEDAAQQTFLSAYRGLLAGQEPREPSAWLGTIARNECRGRLRSRSTEPLTLVTEPSGDETQREVSRHAEIDALSAALAELPPQQRDAIVLREFYGLSYAEVASALGISGAAVESLIFRSRRRLQAELRPLRAALGALVLPPTLRESLSQALPSFGGAGASTGAGAAVLAKLGTTSIAAKLAAGTLALGTLGTVAGLETHVHRRAPRRPAPAARPAAAAAAARVGLPQLSLPASHRVVVAARATETRRHRGSDGSGSSGRDHATETTTETEPTETEHHGDSNPPGTTTSGGDGRGGGGGDGGGSDGGTTTTTTTGGDHGGDGGGDGGGTGDDGGGSGSGD
ncbi:MAG: RNA polymerase sigma factor [Gaiellaceae bacterium]